MGRRLRVLCFFLVMIPVASSCRKESATPRVTIKGRTWYVDLATTPQQQARGLSGRSRLGENVGMLFIYPRPQMLEFCMRGCRIPLDIAFIDADLRIVNICTMAVEPDLAGRVLYRSKKPAQYALEVTAGSFHRARIGAGDAVVLSGEFPKAVKDASNP